LAPHYDGTFFERLAHGARPSAAAVIPLVSKLASPASVLDVGCGVGSWLAEWISAGESADLSYPFSLGRRTTRRRGLTSGGPDHSAADGSGRVTTVACTYVNRSVISCVQIAYQRALPARTLPDRAWPGTCQPR